MSGPFLLSAILLIAALISGVMYGSIVLRGGQRRNSRIEILMSAGGLLMLGLLARTLDRPEELLYCGTAGALLALLVANQWRWHLKTRGARL